MTGVAALDVYELVAWLEAEGAHHDVVRWVKDRAHPWPAAWHQCPRGDWLLAIAHRAGAEPRALRRTVLALAHTVEEELAEPGLATTLSHLREHFDREESPTALVATAEDAADGAPDLALAQAYRVLALAARSYDDPEASALVPGQLVELAMTNVLDCAMMAVVGATQARTADIVRRELGVPALRPQRESASTGSSAPAGTR